MFGDLEKTCSAIVVKTYSAIFGDNASVFWRNHLAILEKTVRRQCWSFGETRSARLWRFRIGVRYEAA